MRGERHVESLREGEEGTLVLDSSSFYAERGGQIGDRGTIVGPSGAFDVRDTQYLGEAIAHTASSSRGEIAAGQQVGTTVHDWWRREIRRHHTSAHLLQRALKDVLGEDVNQAGSWVGIDRMRFDFRWAGGALSPDQKRAVAHRVNEMIRDDSHLETRVLPLEEAKRTGAIWMAGEKYGDLDPRRYRPARRWSFAAERTRTRPANSACSSSSPSRRSAAAFAASNRAFRKPPKITSTRQSDLIGTLSSSLATSPEELGERVGKLQRDVRDLQTALGQLKARLAAADAQAYLEKTERKGDRSFVGAVVREAGRRRARANSQPRLRNRLPSGVIALDRRRRRHREPARERERRSREAPASTRAIW